MNLDRWHGKPIRLTAEDGRVFEGIGDAYPAEYGLHELGREENSLAFGCYQVFESEVRSIEPLPPEALCGFVGAEYAPEELRSLYRDLRLCWCVETCAPRLRERWSAEEPSLGQCSVTAFLVQELFGGRVFGLPLGDGHFHCYNELDGDYYDLTSGQFPEAELELFDYELFLREQFRERHFADAEKKARFELLKWRLALIRSGR